VGVIEVEVPEGIPLKPLKKKIDELVKEEEARWVLFERAKEEINLSEEELEDLEEIRESVWREEKKRLGFWAKLLRHSTGPS
jgi:hypothetical protein